MIKKKIIKGTYPTTTNLLRPLYKNPEYFKLTYFNFWPKNLFYYNVDAMGVWLENS